MTSTNSRSWIYKSAALFTVWLLLSQSTHLFHLGLGLLGSVAIARLNSLGGHSSSARVRWGQAAIYVPWLLWKILQSGIHLSYLILHPRLPIDPKLIRYQTKLSNPMGIVTLGNSITLTPGTITAEINASELVVHAMDDEAAVDLTSFRMERKLTAVFEVKQ